jgi:hypothetical protein
VDAIGDFVGSLPYGVEILIGAAVVIGVRFGLVPLIEAIKKK